MKNKEYMSIRKMIDYIDKALRNNAKVSTNRMGYY